MLCMSAPGKTGYQTELRAVISTVLALAVMAFQMYTAGVQMLTPWLQRDVHLTLVMMMTFLLFPACGERRRTLGLVVDGVLIVAAAVVGLYIVIYYQEIVERLGIPTLWDAVFGVAAICLVVEMVRRGVGWALVAIVSAALIYNFAGPFLPGMLGHRGYPLSRVASQMYLTTEGIFGVPLGVSATYVYLFVFFTCLLQVSGMGDFLLRFALSMTGRMVGGPAKTAVIASGLFGTISGSAVANVVGTGSFTIPMMIRMGYKPHFAGAVEASASSGGQIMPPIMGAAAFIIAEFLGIPYISVAAAAVIPAILYYASVMWSVHFEALRMKLVPLSREEIPRFWDTLKEGFHLLVPIAVLLYLLAVEGYTPIKAAYYSILLTIPLSYVRRETRITWSRFVKACQDAAKNTITVATACAAAGLVIGSINLTGLGLKISTLIIGLSGGKLWLALILSMVAALIMGMGLPTTAAYIIVGTLGAPALVKMGVLPLAAHLFVFYFAVISAVTPPVALAAYAASGIAKEDPMKIGWTACLLTLSAFVVPYMLVYNPALIGAGGFGEVAWCSCTAFVGVSALSASVIGYMADKMEAGQRILTCVGALMLIIPELYTDLAGFILVAGGVFWHWHGKGRRREAAEGEMEEGFRAAPSLSHRLRFSVRNRRPSGPPKALRKLVQESATPMSPAR